MPNLRKNNDLMLILRKHFCTFAENLPNEHLKSERKYNSLKLWLLSIK